MKHELHTLVVTSILKVSGDENIETIIASEVDTQDPRELEDIDEILEKNTKKKDKIDG